MQWSRIVVLGLGGIGSQLLPPLMRLVGGSWSSHMKYPAPEIVLADGDKYSIGNTARQEFPASYINRHKSEAQAARYTSWWPELRILEFREFVGAANVASLIPESTIVMMCVDNHVCRHLVSERISSLSDGCLITGSNEKLDGNVQIHFRCAGTNLTPSIELRHPEIATAEDGDRSEMSCEELEQLPGGGQILVTNLVAATIMLELLWGVMELDATSGQALMPPEEVYFDVTSVKTAIIRDGVPA